MKLDSIVMGPKTIEKLMKHIEHLRDAGNQANLENGNSKKRRARQ